MAVADQIAAIPLVYVRNVVLVKRWVKGWWEYGKSWSSFADLDVAEHEPVDRQGNVSASPAPDC